MTGGDQEKSRRQAAQKAVKSMMQTNENDAQIEALLDADEHRQAHEKRSGNGLERNDLDTGEWRNGNNFSDLLDIDSEEEAEEEVDNEIDCLVARLQQLRATKKAARTRKSPKSTETFLAPNSVDLNDLRAPTFQQLGALNPNVLCWPQNQQASGYATPSVACLGNQSLHTACSHTVVNGFPPVPEVSAFQPNPTCGMPPIKTNMGHFNSPHTWQGAQCLPQHQPAHAYPQHPLQMLSQQPQAPFSPLHQPYVTYTPQHNPMNSSNTEMGQVMGQLANVVSWQAAQTRREELKSIPKLDGFEGHAKVTEFFRQFEDATEGCSDREREKLLRKKCLNRAKHLLEDVLETVNNNYELVKATLLMEISGASTEREEALQKLSAGLFRGYRESLNSYSGRITETVKAAFPGMTKEGRESPPVTTSHVA
ncbi:hypothetical protein L596_022880 [Steinernema carpocapsae]|uniref:Uncharacterized protein n=1 Tax=Steinernema carpocapsae TaxID=34508 RepID=A0A4U5MBV4_STECR|nr:hypothetical protein L596_022880 [Steinernema carpocapsae]